MKRRFIVIAIALTAATLLSAIGCCIFFPNGTKPLKNISDPGAFYADSVSEIQNANDLILDISFTKETIIGNNTFIESTKQALTCSGLNSPSIRFAVTELFTIGKHSVNIAEFYDNGAAYVSVSEGENQGLFTTQIAAEDYAKRFAPAILITPELYGSIICENAQDNFLIHFTQPTQAETWVSDENTQFIDAEGSATITHQGKLLESSYSVTLQSGDTQIRLHYTVCPNATDVKIDLPKNLSDYVTVTYLDGAKMLERATGYRQQAKNLSAYYKDKIYFQAFGDTRTQQINIHTVNKEELSAVVNTDTNATNASRVDQSTQLLKTELFDNNTYQSKTDTGNYITNNEVSSEDMLAYCQNLLIGTVMFPQYVTGIQMQQNTGKLHISFAASDAFASLVAANACETLYKDPALLAELAQSNSTKTLECYLELDSLTGLPTASGIAYVGEYTVGGMKNNLKFEADQSYDLISEIAEAQIQKAAG